MGLLKTLKGEKNNTACCRSESTDQNGVHQNNIDKNITRVVINFDCGFGNSLYIRGEGIPGLNWQKGVMLRNTKANEWIWETDKSFTRGEFKILINDKQFEIGENHKIERGIICSCAPKF